MENKPVLGPVHPDFEGKLEPQYVEYHNTHLKDLPSLHELPWDPACRQAPSKTGSTDVQPVGNTQDIQLSKCKARIYTPKGDPPVNGWPCFLFFHGGGWTLGTINSENAFCTSMCNGAQCVVITVDYRLAPEIPFPAGVEDAVESLQWMHQNAAKLNVDINKLAVGGSSSGGNLAAVAALEAVQLYPTIPLKLQLLIVPVTDNTASEDGQTYPSWRENAQTPWLNTGRMMWFRHNYLPQQKDWNDWKASPIFAPDTLASKVAPAWIACMEYDILRDEGVAYGKKLKDLGVSVETIVYERVPHQIMVMDAVLATGAKLVSDAAAALRRAFHAE